MSMSLMVQAMKARVGNPLRKLVLIKLADNASDTGECWPAVATIAYECEISSRSVQTHIWSEYLTSAGNPKLQKRVREKMVVLTWLAAQDAAARNENGTFKESAGATLAHTVDVAKSSWSDTYARPWEKLKEIARELDVSALMKVTQIVELDVATIK